MNDMPMARREFGLRDIAGIDALRQPLKAKPGAPVWYPLLPLGTYDWKQTDGAVVTFTITRECLDEMVAHFRSGLPGPMGIPVDETNLHGAQHEGADAWIKDLQIRADGLWGLVEVTSTAGPALERRPYLSPKFSAGGGVDPKYGVGNFLRSCALVSQPWVYPQPGMVSASAMTTLDEDESGTGDGAGTDTSPEGGAPMPDDSAVEPQLELEEEKPEVVEEADPEEAAPPAEETTEEVADETVDETAPDTTEEEAADATDALAEAQARVAELEQANADLLARAEAAEATVTDMQTRLTNLEAKFAEVDRDAAIAAKVNELAQVEVIEAIKTDEGYVEESRRLDPKYVELAASAAVLKTPEANDELQVFLAQHNHKPPTVSAGHKPALQPINASAAAPALTEWQKLEAASFPINGERDRSKVRATMMSMTDPNFEEALRTTTLL